MEKTNDPVKQAVFETAAQPETLKTPLGEGSSALAQEPPLESNPSANKEGFEASDFAPSEEGASETRGESEETRSETPQKRRGAPFGNTNGFVNGSTYMKDAKQGLRPAEDSKLIARRFAKALIDDLGGKGILTAQKLEVIDHLKRDKETLQDLYACRDDILEKRPETRRRLDVLSKIDSFIAPVQTRVVNNLQRLGLERVAKTIDLAPWEEAKIVGKK